MPQDLIPVCVFVAGLMLGAWLDSRARSGESPLPRLWPEKKEPKEKTIELPRVKP